MLQSTHIWNDDNHAEAVELWRDGKSMREIADHFCISRGAVSGYVSRNRDVFSPRNTVTERFGKGRVHSAWTEARIDAASRLWAEGVHADEIAENLGVTKAALSDITRRFRARVPKRERMKARTKVDLDALFEEIEATSLYDGRRYQLVGREPVAFAALKAKECKFPVSASDEQPGPEMACCGAPVEKGPYCSAHAAICWRARA